MDLAGRLAERIKRARNESGLSQFNFGVLAGIDEATAKSRVSHYENGISVPPPTVLQQFAIAANKPVSWFYCEEDELQMLASLYLLSENDRADAILKINGLI